jgi:outer membrane protein TolC
MKHLNLLSIAAIAFALTLNGCTVGPDYVQPDTEEPDAWHTAAVEGLEDGEATLQTWWQVFDDEKLSELVLRSAEGNLDLRSALWRVEEARALRGVVSSVGKPQVGFSADANRSLPSENGTLGDFAPEEGFEAENLFTAGVGASWELDVFGRVRRQVEAADAATQASIEAYRDVLVSLYAETALAYVNVRASQERLRIRRRRSNSPRTASIRVWCRRSMWPRPKATSPIPTP